ncbi:MAG: hypothetical protein IH918_05420 [Acidobacteria bacterium]|nr:hypothetical protein [Acidobacteriota bacterium]
MEIRNRPLAVEDFLPADMHPVLKRIYLGRGIGEPRQLDLSLGGLLPVGDLGSTGQAVDLLLAHRQKNSLILIVGDFDADGATSTALLMRGLKQLGFARLGYLLPDRFLLGYGLTPAIVELAGQQDPGLIITVDNGISSIDGVALARKMGIEVLVPDINESESDFTVHDGRIRFGLSAVRNVGEGAVEKIIEARQDQPLKSFMDFVNRVDTAVLNKRSIESLIKAGAFDGRGDTRKGLTLVHEQILDATLERRRNEEMGQYSLFAGDDDSVEETNIEVPDLAWPQKTRLAFEKEMLGLYVSDHPLLSLGAALAAATSTSIAELGDLSDRSSLSVGGIVGSITRRWTKKGDPMLFFQLEDLEGSVECIAFPKTVHDYGPLIVEDAVLVISGHLDHRGDDVKVVARELKELEIRDDSTIRLTIPAGRLTPETVNSLKTILKNHPGSASVYLHMTDDGDTKVLKLSDAHKVEPRSALFAELKELLGPKAIL